MRVGDWTMAALFALAAVLQLNDADPVLWVALYGIAAAISGYFALTSRLPRVAAAVLAAAAAAWAGTIAARGSAFGDYFRMFDEWEMRSLAVEEAREATGLVIVAVWMVALVIRSRRR